MQEDIAKPFLRLLTGAMDELALGNPWDIATDVGPIITAQAANEITAHVEAAAAEGRLIHRLTAPQDGSFVAPALIRVAGIGDLGREVFGPVLHVATYRAADLDRVIADVNATGYGLTFGLHSRIDDRVQQVAEAVHAGNIYANRNQIGAIVGSQPFGGEGLSGTGPKAGGPTYLARFTRRAAPEPQAEDAKATDVAALSKALTAPRKAQVTQHVLPGPTGELNRLSILPRPPVLCAGPGEAARKAQIARIEALGGIALPVAALPADRLADLPDFGGLVWWGDAGTARAYADALCERPGPILPLITGLPDRGHACQERHLCVDTTAAGGNAALLAGEN